MSMSQVKMDARNVLEERDAKLQCMDFVGRVTVTHQDGSEFKLENAIAEEQEFGKFKILLVWTEHCDCFYFFVDDLEGWKYEKYDKPDDGFAET